MIIIGICLIISVAKKLLVNIYKLFIDNEGKKKELYKAEFLKQIEEKRILLEQRNKIELNQQIKYGNFIYIYIYI